MSICSIIAQLSIYYGKPDTMSLFHNDALFRSPFPATKAPEMLFYKIEKCQEIQMISQDPYTPKQIIGNNIHLLMQLGIFPLKEFDTWEAMPVRMSDCCLQCIQPCKFKRKGHQWIWLVIRSLDLLKKKRSEISGRDLQKPVGEFKNRNTLQDDKY